MKWRWLTAVMVFLNAILFAVVLWQAWVIQQLARRQSSQQLPVQANPRPALTETAFDRARRKLLANPSFAALGSTPGAGFSAAAFNWRLLESPEYRSYVAELRANGCPEETLRDIVTADVSKGFAARRAELVADRYRDFKFWDAKPAMRLETDPGRRAVDSEMAEVLQRLLGPDMVPPDTARDWKHAEWEQQLAFLPPARRAQTLEVLVRYEDAEEQYRLLATNKRPPGDPNDPQQIVSEYQQRRDELRRLLSPEEFAQLDMTLSWTANNLRRAMVKFRPTETEFRAIFGAWRPLDEELGLIYARGERGPGNQQVFDKIRSALGEERYAEYRRTWWK